MPKSPLWDNEDFLNDCRSDMSKADVMEKWQVSSGLVVDVRKEVGGPRTVVVGTTDAEFDTEADSAKLTLDSKGGSFSNVKSDSPITDWSGVFKQFNLDPDSFEIVDDTVRMSMWQQSKRTENGDRDVVNLYSYRAQFRKINPKEKAEFESILERIRTFTPLPSRDMRARSDESQIVVPSDLQVGKSDWNGGSEETAAQALASFATAAEFAREERPAEICIVDPGDAIENMFNTPSQLATNDLTVDRQIELALHIFLSGVEMLAPLAPSLRFAGVSSNHGTVRTGLKAPAGDVHADYGLAIARMMRRALKLNPREYSHVTVQTPEPYMESLAFETSGSTVGVVHGHQASGPDKIGEWWKGQSLGNMPTADARILIAGHWHSTRYYQVGDSRHLFVSPSGDRGSSWFTNIKGDSSTSGMLMFTTRDNEWGNLSVI